MMDQLHGENFGWVLLNFPDDYFIKLVRSIIIILL